MKQAIHIISIYIIITALTGVSCSRNSTSSPNVVIASETGISIEPITHASTNDLIDSMYYLGLTAIKGELPTNINKIHIANGNMYILDNRRAKIFAYDLSSGEPQFLIVSRGTGPMDYVETRAMTVDENFIYVIDNATHRLLLFDSNDGHFVKSEKMPVVADDIEVLDNGNLLLASVPLKNVPLDIDQANCRLFVVDKEMNIIDSYYDVIDDCFDLMGQKNIFTRCSEGIVYSTTMLDGFTIIDTANPSIQKRIRLPFKKGLEGRSAESSDDLLDYQFMISAPYICRDNIYMQYCSSGEVITGVWNSSYDGILNNSPKDLSKALLPVAGVTDDCFIAAIDEYDMYASAIKSGFTKAPDNIEYMLKSDCCVALIFYKLKKCTTVE